MSNTCFSFIDIPKARSIRKPRSSGLTMFVDSGLPCGSAEDLMNLVGPYTDFVKIMTGTARLYPRDYLIKKLDIYRQADVRPFIGGQFLEYVLAVQGRSSLPFFFEEAQKLGFSTIEVSDNCLPLTDSERHEIIQEAVDSGLSVMGEVGSKDENVDVETLMDQARICFEAGAELVLVEAAELIEDGIIKTEMLDSLRTGLDLERVMIELPGPWISGVDLSLVEDMKKTLVREFGQDVNLANVAPDEIISTEALRVGLGVVGPKVRHNQN